MRNDKVCAKCGQPAAARLNEELYVCATCAEAATLEYLNHGLPVVWRNKGVPEYIIVPVGRNQQRN